MGDKNGIMELVMELHVSTGADNVTSLSCLPSLGLSILVCKKRVSSQVDQEVLSCACVLYLFYLVIPKFCSFELSFELVNFKEGQANVWCRLGRLPGCFAIRYT